MREQFAKEVETWAGKVQGEVERQGREIETLRKDMEASTSELSTGLAKCKGDLDRGLVQVRVLVQETQKQLLKAIERLDSRVLNMNGKWGEDIARILNVSQETNAAVDKHLSLLSEQNDSEYTCLQNMITETTKQQTVLITAIESMEDQLAQVPTSIGGSEGL